MKNLILSILALFFVLQTSAEVVSYGPDKKFEGFLVKPKKLTTQTPGILMIHNWMGLSEETKKQAQRFADLGYVVFLADIYGKDNMPKNQKEAGAIATTFKTDRKLFRERLNQSLEQLKSVKNIDLKKLAVVGYCFGGTGAIELARSGANINGAISFHGGLDSPTPDDGKNIKAKILALHGAIDPFVSAKDIQAFESEMQSSHVDYQLVKYADTVHSFTEQAAGDDITKGAAYNLSSDKRSFVAAQNFLSEIFKK